MKKQKLTTILILLAISKGSLSIELEKDEFLHYEYIKITLTNKNTNMVMRLLKDGVEVPDFLGRTKILPKGNGGSLVFLYIPKYGIPSGKYEVVIYEDEKEISRKSVYFLFRQQCSLKEPLKVLTFEENIDISSILSYFGKKSKVGNYELTARKIKDFMDKMGLNTFLILGGQTTLLKDKRNVWFPRVVSNTIVLKYLKEKGVQTGAYVMSFLTLGQNEWNKFKMYKPNLIYRNGKITKDYKYVSITSGRRVKDIIEMLYYLGSQDYIDFLGVDFIRVGDYGGAELLPDFYEEILINLNLFNVNLGAIRVDEISNDIICLAKFVYSNSIIKNLFRWYQSVRISRIIKEIKDSLRRKGINKPLIAFMLGWNAGREHGQDIFMFQDAGIDYSFYMLYEFYSDKMFEQAGNFYLKEIYNRDSNILFGNIVDVILNKGNLPPLKNFRNRIIRFMNEFSYFTPNGFFVHDLYRILRGRKGDYSVKEWLDTVNEISLFLDRLRE